MDDYLEIDLKKIIRTLFDKKFWIIGVTLAIGLAVFLFFFLKPDEFESKAMIALIQPRYEAQFDSDITTTDPAMPGEALITNAALSNEIVQQLFTEWSEPQKDEMSLDSFKENALKVSLESKGAVVTLSVKANTPEEAARLANLWADLTTKLLNSTYYGIDEAQVVYFQDQLEQAKLARDTSSNALVEFAATDISNYLGIQLSNIDAQVGDTLQRKQLFEAAVFDIQGLLDYLPDADPEASVRQNDLLNFTLIQTRVYGSPVVTGLAGSPTQLQLAYQASNESITYREFVATLKDWIIVLDASIAELDVTNQALAAQVTALQSQINNIQMDRSLLETDYDLNESTYKTLKTKLEEVLLNFDPSRGNAQVLSKAIPPEESLPHGTVKNTLIAMVAGIILSSIAVLLLNWWKTEDILLEETKA